MIKNAIFDEERRAITYADRRTTWYIWTSLHRKNHCSWTPDKDTSAASITTVTFKNHGHATRLTFIQSTKLYALPVQHGNLQRRINIIRNSNPTWTCVHRAPLISKGETKVNLLLFLRWNLCFATTMNHFYKCFFCWISRSPAFFVGPAFIIELRCARILPLESD